MNLYYIQNVGYSGNCLKWWKPDGQGYTLDLNHAWKVTQDEASEICRSRPQEDIPWPVEQIDALSARHLNSESLTGADRARCAGRRNG